MHLKLNVKFTSLPVIIPKVRIFTQPQNILCYLKCRHIPSVQFTLCKLQSDVKYLCLYLPRGRLSENVEDKFAKKKNQNTKQLVYYR